MAQHRERALFVGEDDSEWLLSTSGVVLDRDFLDLPERARKPRDIGLTVAIDGGLPTALFRDYVTSHGDLLDAVKFGWGTSLATRDLQYKLDLLQGVGIDYFFGGTLFEKALQQNRVDRFFDFCAAAGCRWLEISNGTLPVAPAEKARYITQAANRFRVMSEVGRKDGLQSAALGPDDWIAEIERDFAAGAELVVAEARESGTSGICDAEGRIRCELIDGILGAGIRPDSLIFEAPNKAMQTHFIRLLGSNANLGNIAFNDLVGLETLRLGLRSDTLQAFDRENEL